MGSVLLNGVRIGAGSVVAAGAVVPEGLVIPPGSVVVGVPARVTRTVDEALRARIRSTWEHYVAEAERHRAGRFPLARASLGCEYWSDATWSRTRPGAPPSALRTCSGGWRGRSRLRTRPTAPPPKPWRGSPRRSSS